MGIIKTSLQIFSEYKGRHVGKQNKTKYKRRKKVRKINIQRKIWHTQQILNICEKSSTQHNL